MGGEEYQVKTKAKGKRGKRKEERGKRKEERLRPAARIRIHAV
jgi:hypothetical protein